MITDKQLQGICSEIATAKEAWLAQMLGTLLPPVCIRWIREGKNLEAVSRLMEKRRIRLEITQGDSRVTRLMCGDAHISTFEVMFHHTHL